MEFIFLNYVNGADPALVAKLPCVIPNTAPDGTVHEIMQLGMHMPEERITIEELAKGDPTLAKDFAAMLARLYKVFRTKHVHTISDPEAMEKLASDNARKLQEIANANADLEIRMAEADAKKKTADLAAAAAHEAVVEAAEISLKLQQARAELADLEEQKRINLLSAPPSASEGEPISIPVSEAEPVTAPR